DGRLRRRHGAAGRGRGDRRQELRPLAPPGRRFAAPPGDLDGKDARAAGDGDQRPANVREPPLGTIAISSPTFDAAYPNVTAANTPPLDHVVARFPDARVQSEAEFLSSQEGGDPERNLLSILLALSVIVSLFGIVNTLV